MEGLVLFDFETKNHSSDLDYYIDNYGKFNGYYSAILFDLPIIKHGVIIKSEKFDFDYIKKMFKNEKILCRADTPFGLGNKLPRGKDLYVEDIKSFLKEIKLINKKSILICFKHPTYEINGKYIPRYRTTGAFNINFNINDSIIIEHVGAGFDVGELTRGKSVHNSILVPWKSRLLSPKDIYKFMRKNIIYHNKISQELYTIDRDERIKELETNLGEKGININDFIPLVPKMLDIYLFKKIYNSIVVKILQGNIITLGSNFSVLINMYNNKIVVFEIWKIKRSTINRA